MKIPDELVGTVILFTLSCICSLVIGFFIGLGIQWHEDSQWVSDMQSHVEAAHMGYWEEYHYGKGQHGYRWIWKDGQ